LTRRTSGPEAIPQPVHIPRNQVINVLLNDLPSLQLRPNQQRIDDEERESRAHEFGEETQGHVRMQTLERPQQGHRHKNGRIDC